jgi:ribonuclease HI
MKVVDIYPDGSCADNGRPNAIGGWSFVVTLPNSTNVIAESFGKLRAGKQTNNRAELEAAYQAMLWVDSQKSEDTVYKLSVTRK